MTETTQKPVEAENCDQCHRCIDEFKLGETLKTPHGDLHVPLSSMRMILCPQCGNKRCPKASDHRLLCTGSNEQGQPGSRYKKVDFQTTGAEHE